MNQVVISQYQMLRLGKDMVHEGEGELYEAPSHNGRAFSFGAPREHDAEELQ